MTKICPMCASRDIYPLDEIPVSELSRDYVCGSCGFVFLESEIIET